ncbi:MAG: XRE family transcriptional regulator [Micavibrio aeruginosavorus]|uniref:XRE family transcriptional regulator n=1 Tax=Micavibrio aeruginosavorus TaxID=349221 RepID=A0A2W5A2I2_9BACT|nr:MAG: XRE family transcriptional regulator [Micavibrio aeruginosavorus]
MSITTAQIRGARGILNWSQQDLAQRTGISATSIGSIENGQTTPRASTLETIRHTLERNGIEFLGMDGVRQQSEFIKTYTGTPGFRDFMDHLYETAKTYGGEIVLFNANPVNWYKWLGEEWFKAHSKRMQDLGDKISFRITSKEGENLFISRDFAEYRWFPAEMFNDRALYSYGDNLAFVNFDENEVSVVVLKQTDFAKAFQVLFNIAWDNVAKTPVK